MSRRIFIGLATLTLVAATVSASVSAAEPVEEFRAYWVDAFGEGIFTPAEVDELVAAAKAANMNALVVQVGRRGDCFCNRAVMPRTQAGIAPLPYDPLQTLIDKAHAEGIEVHAWIIATAIWNSATPPTASHHVYNTHGPSKTGHDRWPHGSAPGQRRCSPRSCRSAMPPAGHRDSGYGRS